MFATAIVICILPSVVLSTTEGNIHLLQDEIADALHSCSYLNKTRHKRSNEYSRIDSKQENQYHHVRRNTTQNQMHVLNGTDYDYMGFGEGDAGEKYIKTFPRPALNNSTRNNSSYNITNDINLNRNKRDNGLTDKEYNDQVDTNGIPRETQLWNKIQTSVNSQQSRVMLKDQLRACFQELEAESEDNGCSYSNKLEHCLMLRFEDRNKTYQDINN